jgi:nitroimidazol reductase NimA-like FMN-containing flavoprotein (pyridoxamine 5'-phosphate oxidase superfamily)
MRGIRRKEKAITDKAEIKYILTSVKYVTLAITNGTDPYLVTISHGYDCVKNVIFFHCASQGKKIDYLKINNKVWGQALVDHGYTNGECNHHYSTVQFSGKVEFLSDFEEKKQALNLMVDQLEDQETLRDSVKKDQLKNTAIQKVNIGKITITGLSGKRG